mgnify:FL=1
MLLLRAFYSKFGHMQDKASVSTRQNIEKCLWKTDEFGEPDMSQLKIDSEVATDNDKDEFLDLADGLTDFAEKDIIGRYKNMIVCFINYLQQNNLLKQ